MTIQEYINQRDDEFRNNFAPGSFGLTNRQYIDLNKFHTASMTGLVVRIIGEIKGMEREGGELAPYLEVVKTKNMDKMFDYGFEKARQDIISSLEKKGLEERPTCCNADLGSDGNWYHERNCPLIVEAKGLEEEEK